MSLVDQYVMKVKLLQYLCYGMELCDIVLRVKGQ